MSDTERLLLHICCAPDATVPWPALREKDGYEVTGYFYGNNIHPESEWLMRRDAVQKLADIVRCDVMIVPYEPDSWLSRTLSLKGEPEGGARCRLCFETQLSSAADYAAESGFGCLCTTLTISPHKDPVLINTLGDRICRERGLCWLPRVWRKKDGFKLSAERSRGWGLYRQNYCGCRYSIRSVVSSNNEIRD